MRHAPPTVLATPEQQRHVVQAAGLAPSVHNSQPWRFLARADRLELHADADRRLRVIDPDGRQLRMSCGAALFHARVAARGCGLAVDVRLLPDPGDPWHLADVLLSKGLPPTVAEARLATAILSRHTHRGPFADRQVPSALVEVLRRAAEGESAALRLVGDEDRLVELAVLLSRADEAERRDPRYREELSAWCYDGPPRPDGVPADAAAGSPGSSLRQRDFSLATSAPPGSLPPGEHPCVLALVTREDEPVSWLAAGQALAAVLLRAAEDGVQAQPLGQVTDLLSYRLELRAALGLVGVPQLVLRMGYAATSPVTPRRTVQDVLVAVAD